LGEPERHHFENPRKSLLAALLRHPEGLTRHALEAESGLAHNAITALLRGDDGLNATGLIVETKADRAAPGGGPKPRILRLRDGICFAGVEIGHGHVRIGIAGLDGELLTAAPKPPGSVHYAARISPIFKQRLETLKWIAGTPGDEPGALPRRLSEVFSSDSGDSETSLPRPLVLGVGVSVAGAVDPESGRLICAQPIVPPWLRKPKEGEDEDESGSIACVDWNGESAGKGLRDRLRGGDHSELLDWACHFRTASAANMCAQAELHDGVLAGFQDAIFVKWTGEVSASVVIRGEVYPGSRGLAGGFPSHAYRRRAGKGQDIENGPPSETLSELAGIRRIAADLRRELRLRKKEKSELLRDYFRTEILSIAHGDRGTKEQTRVVNDRLRAEASRLGKALAPTVDMLNPARIVIGGGAFQSRDWPIVAEYLLEGLREEVAAPSEVPAVELARHTDHPALHGAIVSRRAEVAAVDALAEAADALLKRSAAPVLVGS
jgi:predicted NBD/HSP70 family sugar kinase